MEITFLGTGTSHGVPMIDCMLNGYTKCPEQVCQKAILDPRYRRSRASIMIHVQDVDLLIDSSQDFRQQVLNQHITKIDGVLYTHGHADHIYGLPDLRSYTKSMDPGMDIYGSQETLATLRQCFDYVFNPPSYLGGGIPSLIPHVLEEPSLIHGVLVTPVPVEHGPLEGSQGYRIGGLAYIPDVKRIPEASLDLLRDLDLLVLNCLRYRPHAGHLTVEESVAYAQSLAPRRCLLTHVSHDIDYQIEEQRLPSWIRFAYDGQRVELPE